jgi:hypothetical protein
MCPHCGLKYRDFRTGFTYRDVFGMLWSGSDDPSTWRYKRRGSVLGKWFEIKQKMWADHVDECAPPF